MPVEICEPLPTEPGVLATWFLDGVLAELKALEKNGGIQIYEVQSGKLFEQRGNNKGFFLFIIPDGTRIPDDDSNGRLKYQDKEFSAIVERQHGNHIFIEIGGEKFPNSIHWAKLIIDDAALLKRLSETLKECKEDPTYLTSMSSMIFHPSNMHVSNTILPDTPVFTNMPGGELRKVLKQAYGSQITYIWGPPGTGKTYAISYLIAALIETGKRVLVTSNTNSAVDEVLHKSVNSKDGPLENYPGVKNGKVIRIGRTIDDKIPKEVRFDDVFECKAKELDNEIQKLKDYIQMLCKKKDRAESVVSEWKMLDGISNRLSLSKISVEKIILKQREIVEEINEYRNKLQQKQIMFEKAKSAWFRREAKTKKAIQTLHNNEIILRSAQEKLSLVMEEKEKAVQLVYSLENDFLKKRAQCSSLPKLESAQEEFSRIVSEINTKEERLRILQNVKSQLAQKIIDEARAIFCTLTKNYVSRDLNNQKFDAVIIDEISMALPPLIFLAAGRAKAQAILVGDFLQLPPIIRSDDIISIKK